MVVRQGDIWWCDLPTPAGSGPDFRRPVLVVQGDPLNRSRISTIVCVPLTSNVQWENAPGNVFLPTDVTHLPKDSVANVSQVVAVDRALFDEHVIRVPGGVLEEVLGGIDVVLDR